MAADEVSASIGALFSRQAEDYQNVAGRAAATIPFNRTVVRLSFV